MGDRFDDRVARQHPDLTGRTNRAPAAADSDVDDPDSNVDDPDDPVVLRAVVLAILAVDGIISAVVGAFYLSLHIDSVPFPISAVAAGAVNAALVWAATHWTDSARLAALPLWTWLGTVAVLTLGGPGGDIVFGGTGAMAYGVLLYLIVGAGPPVWLLWRRNAVA